jgi:hypothetical protein
MMENVEDRTVRLEIEIPETWHRKILALCELQDTNTGALLKDWIKGGMAQQISLVNSGEIEYEIEKLEDLEGRQSE